ncbi:MAG: replicative DNA helicase [bacterium]
MSNSITRVPPHSPEAEMAVLGSMLIEREAIETVLEILTDHKHFYNDAHQKIFAAILDIHNKGRAVDIITLSEELKKQNRLEEMGGEQFLTELIGKVTTAAHVRHYAEIVRHKAVMRELIRASTGIVERCYSPAEDVDALLDHAETQIFSIAKKQTVQSFSSSKELSHEVMERIEKAHMEKKSVTGVPSGFTRFDEMTCGLQKSDLIILAARPSQGKTAMALNIAFHAAVEQKIPVAIFSLEMGKHAIFERMVCSAARADLHGIRKGYFKRESWTDLTRVMSEMAESPLWIDDTPGLTILDIRTRARRLASDIQNRGLGELGLIIIDYLQLLRGNGRIESRQQEVSDISRQLKHLARTLNVPVVALSQLNRRSEDKTREGNRPQLSDLRESGSLEQDADLVALIWREEYYKRDDPTVKNQAKLIVAKQRNGPVGDVDLNFFHECTRFDNPASPGLEALSETLAS